MDVSEPHDNPNHLGFHTTGTQLDHFPFPSSAVFFIILYYHLLGIA